MTSAQTTRTSVEAQPALAGAIQLLVEETWPTYFQHAHTDPDDGRVDWGGLYRRWPHLQLALLDGDRIIASAHSAPLAWDGDPADLPAEGWDWAMRRSRDDRDAGRTPTTLCGLAVTIARDRQGEGLSRVMLKWMHAVARQHGMERLIVPVRPSHKPRHPNTPMAEYATWTRDDGLPRDPWIRTHTRIGGRIVGPCDRAMCMIGTTQEWSQWLGVDLPTDGEQVHPDLLAPLKLSGGIGRYTEPNLWIIHG
ncbi:MAG: hypothetical protein ACI8RZ_001077 [Myxococcota bacterium]|jgi:hypothetical protein